MLFSKKSESNNFWAKSLNPPSVGLGNPYYGSHNIADNAIMLVIFLSPTFSSYHQLSDQVCDIFITNSITN